MGRPEGAGMDQYILPHNAKRSQEAQKGKGTSDLSRPTSRSRWGTSTALRAASSKTQGSYI
jgi:hypothetical protein